MAENFETMKQLDRLIVDLKRRGVMLYRKSETELALNGNTQLVTPEEKQLLRANKQLLLTVYPEEF